MVKSSALMQPDRSLICGFTDDGHHLAEARFGTGLDETIEQGCAKSPPYGVLIHIDRIFDSVTVGGSAVVGRRVRIASDGALQLGDEVGKSMVAHGLIAALKFLHSGWFFLERRVPVQDMVSVNIPQNSQVPHAGVTNEWR